MGVEALGWVLTAVFVVTIFLGPAIAHELGWQRLSDALIWVLAFFLGIGQAFLTLWWFLKIAFNVLRWVARFALEFASPSRAAFADIHPHGMLPSPCLLARTVRGLFSAPR